MGEGAGVLLLEELEHAKVCKLKLVLMAFPELISFGFLTNKRVA